MVITVSTICWCFWCFGAHKCTVKYTTPRRLNGASARHRHILVGSHEANKFKYDLD